jgi:protein-tyrosine kinase
MSKNFELLTQLGEIKDLPLPPEGTEDPPTEDAGHLQTPPLLSSEIARPAAGMAPRPMSIAGRVVTASPEEIQIVQHVFILPGEEAPQCVVFCGVDNRDGAASVCARAGEILAAHTSGRICVMDGDTESPSLHHCFAAENRPGWTDGYLGGYDILSLVVPIKGSNLSLLPAGSGVGEKRIITSTDRLRMMFDRLRKCYEYVLISAPPAGRNPEALLLGQLADGVVLSLSAGSTRRATAAKVRDSLEASNIKLLGAILSGRTFPIPESLYRKL